MASAKNKEDDFLNVTIYENILILRGRALQIKNISRITAYAVGYNSYIKALVFILFLFSIGPAYVAMQALNSPFGGNSSPAFSFPIIISCVLFFSLLFVLFNTKHGVQIQTNGGTSDFLITSDKNKAEELLSKLAFIMEGDLDLEGKTVTINNKFDIVEGDQIYGDKFNKLKDAVIFKKD